MASLFRRFANWNKQRKAKEFYPEIMRIEALTSPYTVKGKEYSHQPMPYRKVSLGFRNYGADVEYWKEIGKLNPDALASVGLLGGDMVQQLVGIPIKFIKKDS
ncbi:hypothetical protein A3K73_02245 [Candidatus Pacearchaeota archaeon RBG_13_36_9]|nr:MAG: hypothetical protein A3K73_02245 [Candidatus Pacearchaeota archaeon RBG_13_36_9]